MRFIILSCALLLLCSCSTRPRTTTTFFKYHFIEKERPSNCMFEDASDKFFPLKLNKQIRDEEAKKVFAYIESICNVKFVKAKGFYSADIVIGSHSFKGSIMAHASSLFYWTEFIHFDKDRSWHAISFHHVFMHELGHNLRLPHNPNVKSVMYKTYNSSKTFDVWDIHLLVRKYGPPLLK